MTKTGNKVAPTSTALQARVALFQPSRRPVERQGDWLETSFGKCRVKGRLGQRHADVLEATLYVAERKREISDGGIELLVDPYKLRSALTSGAYSYEGIQKIFTELRTATLEIITPELEESGDKIIGGLIDHVVPSPMTRHNPLGKERNLWRVRLGVALVMLLEKDLNLYYEPTPISQLKHGVSQAVARHVLTHARQPSGGWHVDTLLKTVYGSTPTVRNIQNGRARLKQDAEKLKSLGIKVENGRVFKC